MPSLRVLIADDSLTVRERLRAALADDPLIEVVGTASNGREALEMCLRLRPDVVSLDMMMPVMTGLAATELIMARCPTPILVVSASFERGEAFRTYDALAAGAVDVLEKPIAGETGDAWDRLYRDRLRRVARIRVVTHLRARGRGAGSEVEAAAASSAAAPRHSPRVVAIGASTGGPAALAAVLAGLGARPIPVPILVVIHIDRQFGGHFAHWLGTRVPRPVQPARDGTPIAELGGVVVLAPADRHMTLACGRIRLDDGAPRQSCRPSIDVLFESVAADCPGSAVGVVLTGMGRDGAAGLLALRRSGALTIAQDEATSVVYGMPREAVRLGAATEIRPLGAIAAAILQPLGVLEPSP